MRGGGGSAYGSPLVLLLAAKLKSSRGGGSAAAAVAAAEAFVLPPADPSSFGSSLLPGARGARGAVTIVTLNKSRRIAHGSGGCDWRVVTFTPWLPVAAIEVLAVVGVRAAR